MCWAENNRNCLKVMLRKNDPLYFLYIRSFYPRIECLVSFPRYKMLFNIAFVSSAHYFKPCLGFNNDIEKFVIVKLTFDWAILEVYQFGNWLGQGLLTLTPRNFSVEKVCSYPWQTLPFLLLSSLDIPL